MRFKITKNIDMVFEKTLLKIFLFQLWNSLSKNKIDGFSDFSLRTEATSQGGSRIKKQHTYKKCAV